MVAVKEREISKIVKSWDRRILEQNMRASRKKYPEDIAMIIRNFDESGEIREAFPIFYKDKVEDVITKYCNVFAEEAIAFNAQLDMEKSELTNQNGMSTEKNLRLGCILPERLNFILQGWSEKVLRLPFPSEWWWKKIKEVLPKCFIGSMREESR